MRPLPRFCTAALLIITTSCATRLSEPQSRVLVGGIYDYTAIFLDGNQPVLRGVLRLQDGADDTAGGSYRLPGQCQSTLTSPAAIVDCVGSVIGTVDAGRAIRFDFDNARFHHTGVIGVDGTITGLWTITFPSDSTGVPQRVAGQFRAVPAR